MACGAAALLKHFPDAIDVVLVHSERWTKYDTAIMDALVEGARRFFCTMMPFVQRGYDPAYTRRFPRERQQVDARQE